MRNGILAIGALMLAAIAPGLPAATAQVSEGECGGTVVYECTHKHGTVEKTCTLYVDGDTHYSGGPPEFEYASWCLHYWGACCPGDAADGRIE